MAKPSDPPGQANKTPTWPSDRHYTVDVNVILTLPPGGQLDRIETALANLTGKVVKVMAVEDDILAKVTAETTVIASIKTLVDNLQANAGDPVKLAAIVSALDANDVALGVIANAGSTPPGPPAP